MGRLNLPPATPAESAFICADPFVLKGVTLLPPSPAPRLVRGHVRDMGWPLSSPGMGYFSLLGADTITGTTDSRSFCGWSIETISLDMELSRSSANDGCPLSIGGLSDFGIKLPKLLLCRMGLCSMLLELFASFDR